MQQALFPDRREPRPAPPLAVLDLETEGLGGPFLAGGWLLQHEPQPHYFCDIEDLFAALEEHAATGVIWYAHNAAGFDLKYLLDSPAWQRRLARGWSAHIVCSGQSVVLGVRLQWRQAGSHARHACRRHADIRDSLRLLPLSLDSAAATFAPDLPKLVGAIDFEHGEHFDLRNQLHRAYLERDLRSLLAVLERFGALVRERFGVGLGWTLPATSARAWLRTLQIVVPQPPPDLRAYFRRAYYGGMVRPGQVHATDATHLDRRSAYASVMLEDLPVGRSLYVGSERHLEWPGIYRIRAVVPADTPLTVLPLRTPIGVHFPTGHFETYCTSAEIALALELGQQVVELDGYCWPQSAPICRVYILRCQVLRRQDYRGPLGLVAKLLQNSLYGKFGMGEQQRRYRYALDPPTADSRSVSPPSAAIPLWMDEAQRESALVQPQLAAWITARQRVLLAQAILATGPDQHVYSDTDSLVTICAHPEQVLAVGEQYGQWQISGRDLEVVVAAPKTYAERDATGRVTIVAKGLPVRTLHWAQVAAAAAGSRDQRVPLRTTTGLLRMLRAPATSHAFQEIERAISTPVSSAGWRLDGGRYRPISVGEE